MSPKIKVLFCGRIDSPTAATTLVEKLYLLQTNSKAGPFDVAFTSCNAETDITNDKCSSSSNNNNNNIISVIDALITVWNEYWNNKKPMNIALYIQDSTALRSYWNNQQQNNTEEILSKSQSTTTSSSSSSLLQLGPNLFVLRDRPIQQPSSSSSPITTTTTTITTNVHDEPQAGIWNISIGTTNQSMVVVSLPPLYRTIPTDTTTTTINNNNNNNNNELTDAPVSDTLQQTITHVSYRGCDVFLSTEWPQGIENILGTTGTATTTTNNNNDDDCLKYNQSLLLSFDVADIALKARAQYHIAFGSNNNNIVFQQSPAFQHCRATTSTVDETYMHTGRFIALCPTQTTSKNKLQKYIHAVGVVPLQSQGSIVQDQSLSTNSKIVPCPYTDEVYAKDEYHQSRSTIQQQNQNNNTPGTTNPRINIRNTTNVGLSEAAARRILEENSHPQMTGINRWCAPNNSMGNNRKQSRNYNNNTDATIDPNNTTLFVYGLHLDVTGRLPNETMGDVLLMQVFAVYKALRIRRPTQSSGHTSSFCFVEFETHQQAAMCLQQTMGNVTVEGIHLTVKWATTNNAQNTNHSNNNPAFPPSMEGTSKRQRLMESDARDSSTIYFKLALCSSDAVLPALMDAGETIRQVMEHTLEQALAGDNVNETDRVKASDEPALQVQIRFPTDTEQKTFGFLDFASHAAASMALAILTGSTDGGRVLEEQQQQKMEGEPTDTTIKLLTTHVGIYLHWAQPKLLRMESDRHERDMVEDASAGFRFERKHFPADARKDCWFCLASESCEKHLITGVYNTCYAAMPKGPVHPGHILLVPVQHSSRGALEDTVVATEMEEHKVRFRQHASSAYDCEMFVFERAIQTKGGYHTHVQCIPVERKLGLRLQTTMLAQAQKIGMDLREINSDVALKAILSSNDEDLNEETGYFYAEIPIAGMEFKRFLYKTSNNNRVVGSRSVSVPLQFGREILAAVLGKPELAHWKSCLVDQTQEASIAAAFRDSFASYVTSK